MKQLIIAFFASIFVLCHSGVFALSENFDAVEGFYNGGSAYKQGDYKTAIKNYEEILRNGLASGELYYNLGNSYFKTKALGKAILNYERARLLIPRDSDLESNYHYAISLIDGYRFAPEHSFIHRLIHGYSGQLTVDELTIISFLLCLLSGIIYLAGLFLKWPSKVSLSAIIVLIVLFASHTFFLIDKIHYQKSLAVVLSKNESKFEPIEKATTHFKLPEGAVVQVLKENGDWFKIKRSDNKAGWSRRNMLEKIQKADS